MTEREKLLFRIREKGGIIGYAAAHYMHDEENGNKFIIECFEQCHNQSAWDHWGRELVLDITDYALRLQDLEQSEKIETARVA